MKNHNEAKQDFPAFLTLSWAWWESMEDAAAVSAALARNLRHYRERGGLSHKALALVAGVGLGDIRSIEGGRTLPAIGILTRLADALCVECSALVECSVTPAAAVSQLAAANTPIREGHAVLA